MKKLLWLLVIVGFNIQAQTVSISKTTGQSDNCLVVKGNTGKPLKWCWLELTYKLYNGKDFDLPSGLIPVKGCFEKRIEYNQVITKLNARKEESRIIWTAKLWEKKVNKGKCSKGNNNECCACCKQKGYHLEGCIAKDSLGGEVLLMGILIGFANYPF